MEVHWMWWLSALLLVIAEMFSGTFYLLAIAVGLTGAGVAAYWGAIWMVQAITAAALCGASVFVLQRWKRIQPSTTQGNFSYDIGQTVNIANWHDEHHARVTYRGAEWEAQLADAALPDTGRAEWRIVAIKGSLLIIE